MSLPALEQKDDKIKFTVEQITDICFNTEFLTLKEELERIYRECNLHDAPFSAFKDALYVFLTQMDEVDSLA